MLYNKNMKKLLFTLTISSTVILTGGAFVSAAEADYRVYAPQTDKLNIVDTIALHTYCNLSKIFDSSHRDRCFAQSFFKDANVQNINQNTEELTGIKNSLSVQASDIEALKNRPTTTEIIRQVSGGGGTTIIKYVSDTSSQDTGRYNTVVSRGSFAFGEFNTIAIDAPNSFVLGSHIVNVTPSSTQIGTSNKSKLFIGSDGFVGVANSNNGGARTNRLVDEQLRVAGRVRAQGFDVDSAADLAENFPVDEDGVLPGHIIQFSDVTHKWDGYELNGIVRAKISKSAVGVVATNPGIVLGSNTKGLPVAFSGRVPVKVSAENGAVQKGDRVTLSSREEGIGAKLLDAGQSVGIALSSDTGKGMILMLVKNEYVYDPILLLESKKSLSNTSLDTKIGNINQNKNALCIEDVCMDKNILQKTINFINNFTQ